MLCFRVLGFLSISCGVAAGALLAEEPKSPPPPSPSASSSAPRYPCRDEHTFDFWVGDFDATPWNEPSSPARGHLHNTREYEGCVIVERWAAPTSKGMSMSFYDVNRHVWRMVWNADDNRSNDFEGTYRDGAMRFEGWVLDADGKKLLARNVLENVSPDTIRHVYSVSSDGGKTWEIKSDGRFTRSKTTVSASPFEYGWENPAPGVWAAIRTDPFQLPQEGNAQERTWLEKGLAITEELDRENNVTAYVVPTTTFEGDLTLHLGGREIRFLRLGNAHTAGDVILWLPQEKIVATGDVVTAPIPLMPSAYTGDSDYPAVLARIKALGFQTLVPGHGAVQGDAAYIDLLSDTIRRVSAQMEALVARGLPREEAVTRLDLHEIEPRFTHGDPFLANRFHDYLSDLPAAAYAARGHPEEKF